jgi:DNA-binding beta-propeller fold protein YncE
MTMKALAFALLCAATSLAAPTSPPYVYVAATDGGGTFNLMVFNWKTQETAASIAVARNTRLSRDNNFNLAANPNGQYVYALIGAHGGVASSLNVICTATNKVLRTIELKGDSIADSALNLGISPDGKTIWITDYSAKKITVLCAITYQVLATIQLPNSPELITFSPDGKYAYAFSYVPPLFIELGPRGEADAISTVTKRIASSVIFESSPLGIGTPAISKSGSTLYVPVGNPELGIETQGIEILSTNPLAVIGGTTTITDHDGAQGGVAITPNGKDVWGVEMFGGFTRLAVIDSSDNTLASFNLISSDWDYENVAFTPDGEFAYFVGNNLGIARTATSTIEKLIQPPTNEFLTGAIAFVPSK